MGQDLLNPPNVFGWPEGRSWLSTRSMISRSNFATSLLAGELHQSSGPINEKALASQLGSVDQLPKGNWISHLILGKQLYSDGLEETLQMPAAQLG